jgi:hypothetical protein
MPNVARVIAVAGAMLIGLALTGCTLAIDPVLPDAASPTTTTPTPTPTTTPTPTPTPTQAPEAAPEPTACQDEFGADLLWNPESEAPVTAIIRLTNEGAGSCELTGFPAGVDFLADGQPLTISYDGDRVEQADGFNRAGTTVTVDPDASAYVWIWVRRAEPVAGRPACEFPATATELTLMLPGATAPLTAPAAIEVCTDGEMLKYGPVDSEQRVAALGF